jgi:hypothetical protein
MMMAHRDAVLAGVSFALLAGGSACSSGGGSLGEVGTYNDAGSFSSAADAGGGNGGGALRVSITPAAPTVCAGQCVDLSASATGGVAPYSYQWGDGSTVVGLLHVCPTSSTRYSVTATDQSGHGGEFAASNGQASASAIVTVSAACSGDADAISDAAASAPPDEGADAADAAPWTGCETSMSTTWACGPYIDGSSTLIVGSVPLTNALVAHQSYDVTMQVNTVVPTASNFQIEVFGSNASCQIEQVLTLQPLPVIPVLGGVVSIQFCAIAQASESQLVVGIIQSGSGGIGTGSNGVSVQTCAVDSCATTDL